MDTTPPSDTDEQSPSTEEGRPESTVHGVVLAAGTSSRYGTANKLLASVDGEPLVKRAVWTVRDASVDGVTVVVGHEADRVREAIADVDVDVRVNDAFEDGQSTSVATAVEAARGRDVDAIVVALGDMPDVSVESVETLIEVYHRGEADALAAAYDGTRGNPVLFDSRYFDALAAVEGDIGGREILTTDPDAVTVETGDPGVVRDVNRPDDLDRRDGES